jgi:hypothetical protein
MKENTEIFICTLLCLAIFEIACRIEREIPVDKADLLGKDFRLFQGTKAWELAKAVEDENVEGIKFLVKNEEIPVDYREERFKQTLLMLAVIGNKYKSVKTLLELGADPNTPDDTVNSAGENAVILASQGYLSTSPKVLKLLLKHGGNPNSISRGVQKVDFTKRIPNRFFALYEAISPDGDFEKVRILVEAGADVNLQTETTGAGAMQAAIYHDRMDVLLYLLEHGADYHKKFERIDFEHSSEDSTSYMYTDILHELRFCFFPLDSKEYKDKLKVIDFLRKRGQNYWKYQLPPKRYAVAMKIVKRDMKFKNEKELQEYIRKY